MPGTLLPEFVRSNLGVIDSALGRFEAPDPAENYNGRRQLARDLLQMFSLLPGSIERSWVEIQHLLRGGLERHQLSAVLQHVSGQIQTALGMYARFRAAVADKVRDDEWLAEGLAGLTIARGRLEQVAQQMAPVLALADAPSRTVDPREFDLAEAGPFARLADLKARRGS